MGNRAAAKEGRRNNQLKRLQWKELTSWPVGLSFPGQDALYQSQLKIKGTKADPKLEIKKVDNLSPFLPLQTFTALSNVVS